MNKFFLTFLMICIISISFAQTSLFDPEDNFTRQDTLRGSITPEREWWDLTYYHLDIAVDPETKTIKGKNTIQYKVLKKHNVLQVDLQAPLTIEKVVQGGKTLEVISDGNAHFVHLTKKQHKGAIQTIEVYYSGHPKEAVRAPWDGGISWKKDSNGKHFVASSCQGLGASVWWPNKDHMYDDCLLYTSPSPRDLSTSRMPSSA